MDRRKVHVESKYGLTFRALCLKNLQICTRVTNVGSHLNKQNSRFQANTLQGGWPYVGLPTAEIGRRKVYRESKYDLTFRAFCLKNLKICASVRNFGCHLNKQNWRFHANTLQGGWPYVQ